MQDHNELANDARHEPESAALEVSFGTPRETFYRTASMLEPTTDDELIEIVNEATVNGQKIIPTGGGHHAYVGVPPDGELVVVSMRKFNKILRYEPNDFTVGAQAGVPLGELRRTLAANRQEIPVDISGSAPGTLGGWISMGFPGPRQSRHGLLRNYLIGAHGLRAGRPPQRYKTGGMVVKNVAGYDVGKFLIGTLGTTGFILEANFKLRPLPEQRSLRLATFDDRRDAWLFVRALRRARLEPAVVQVLGGSAAARLADRIQPLDPEGNWVLWSFEGNDAQVRWQEREADRLLMERPPTEVRKTTAVEEAKIFDLVCEFFEPTPLGDPAANLPDDLGIVRLAVLPETVRDIEKAVHDSLGTGKYDLSTLADGLTGLLTIRWTIDNSRVCEPLEDLQNLIQSRRGTGYLLYLPYANRQRFPRYRLHSDPSAALANRMRRVFDPDDLFSPSRVLGKGTTAVE